MKRFKLTWRITPVIFSDESKWQSLLKLLDKHNDIANEIAVYMCDDMSKDLSPMDDKRRQTEICKIRFKELRKRGCTVGLNVWPTLNLWPVELKYYPDMPRMVGIDGNIINSVACPISEEFLAYMSEKYTLFTEANPDFIWMDDDCRFTHLAGKYPCFCDRCVKGFKNGKYKTREELVEALNKSENKELRVAWSAYGADRLAKLCYTLRETVDKVNPNIDIGLMTVGATHTTFSGDYIKKCMKAFRSRRGRPGHDLYNDRFLDRIMWKTLEVGRQVLEYPDTTTDIFWEEDSCPQGHLSKSFRTRQNEVSLSIMAGCTGIAFNHLFENDNLDEQFERELDELHALHGRWEKFFEFSKDLKWCGMAPYYSWFMTAKAKAEYAWLKEKTAPDNQNPYCDITVPEKIGPFGIALTADLNNSCATLLSGKTLTAMDTDELKKVFSGNVYMDGSALAALEELGLEEWAGVKIEPEMLPAKMCYMTNHSFNGPFKEFCYRTLPKPAHTLIALDEKVEWLGYRKNKFGEGDRYYISKYENSMGGKVIVNGFDAFQYTVNPCNLYQFNSIAKWFDCPIILNWKNPNAVSRVQPYIRTNGEKAAIMLLNASLDTTNPFEIIVKGNMTKAVLLNPDGSETVLNCQRDSEHLYIDVPQIDGWNIAFILAE